VRVGLDLLFLVPGRSGGRETYARELMAALREVRPDIAVTTFLNRESGGRGWWRDGADRAVLLPRVSALSAPRWALGEVVALPRAAARASVDVVHSPANFAPLCGPFARVVTLHDLIFRRLPGTVHPVLRRGTEVLVPAAARRADRILTGAAAARDDIVSELGIPAERIDVIPHGVTLAGDRHGDAARGRDRLGVAAGRAIALSVSGAVAHKNLGALIDAVAVLSPAERPLLVLAGSGTDALRFAEQAARAGVADDVRLLGAVATDVLEDLYAAAAMLVTATLYEGFGLPVLEAMARDTPVACSDLPVLREVAGDAALYHDPRDPASIAGSMRALAAAGPLADRLRGAGRARVAGYDWQTAARATADAYERAITRSTGAS
jgi:glycosyltransferase involved in cell wall biosynthesis